MSHPRHVRRALGALVLALALVPDAPSRRVTVLGPALIAGSDVVVELGGRSVSLGVAAIGRGATDAVARRDFVVDGEGAARDLGGGATEWWRHARGGLEHGVTIDRRPGGAGPLRVELAVEGATVERVADDAAVLRDDGDVVGHYAGLVALDARGRRLPARLGPRPGGLGIEVNDDHALYPVVIDPLVFDTVVMRPGLGPPARFGDDVDASTGAVRLLVGTSGDDLGTFNPDDEFGSARVMVRSGVTWTEEASLTLPTPAVDDRFGTDVSLSDDGSVAAVGGALGRPVAMFARSGTTWAREMTILDPGVSGTIDLSADGSTLAVGRAADTQIWTRTGTAWAAESTVPCQAPVALDRTGSRAVCGRAGVEVYVRSGTTWSLEQRLLSFEMMVNALDVNGAGDAVAVAAKQAADDVTVVFTRTGTAWTEGARFPIEGSAVDASDGAFLVGALEQVVLGRAGTTWAPLAELAPRAVDGGGLALDPATSVAFTGISGGVVLVTFLDGAPLGETCTTDDDCLSLHCVDGACCTAACTGACESCDAARTGGAEGVCTFTLAGTSCRAPTDLCDAEEVCTGSSVACPTDGLLTGVECRASAGACDPPEVCFGTSAACPSDLVAPASMVCRASSDLACDPLESCDGLSAACPADVNGCTAVDAGTDAGTVAAPDAGTVGSPDAGALDAGTTPAPTTGCGCRASGRPRAAFLLALLAGTLAAPHARPRRRRDAYRAS